MRMGYKAVASLTCDICRESLLQGDTIAAGHGDPFITRIVASWSPTVNLSPTAF